MTERERLTEILKAFCTEDCKITHQCGYCDYGDLPVCASAVADHLLANGVIVPPCKVGTKVYIAYEEHINQVFDGSLVSYSLDAAHLWFNCHYTCGLNMWHPIEDLGKTVFLSREDAEKALKERNEGK